MNIKHTLLTVSKFINILFLVSIIGIGMLFSISLVQAVVPPLRQPGQVFHSDKLLSLETDGMVLIAIDKTVGVKMTGEVDTLTMVALYNPKYVSSTNPIVARSGVIQLNCKQWTYRILNVYEYSDNKADIVDIRVNPDKSWHGLGEDPKTESHIIAIPICTTSV